MYLQAIKNSYIKKNNTLVSGIIYDFVLLVILFSLLIDPTGEFYKLKFLASLLSILFFWLTPLINYNYNYFTKIQLFYIFSFCIAMPIYGFFITFFNSNFNNFTDTSYLGFSVTLILLTPILITNREHFIKIFLMSLRLLQILVLTILAIFIYDGDSIGLSQFFIDRKSMLMGFREYGGILTYYIYFTASPLLIILVVNDSYNLIKKKSLKNILIFITSIIAIFLTGTRFNMLTAILVFPFTFFLVNFNLKKILISTSLLITFLLLIWINPITSSFFSLSEDSNNVKIGYLDTYLYLFSQNPKFIILGQGFNAHDWSIIFKNLLINSSNEGTKTELTYIEMFRVFGIFMGFILNFMIIIMPYLLYKISNKFNAISISLIIYFLSSALNPYIFSTNGVLVFLLFLASINEKNSNNIVTSNL